jgi:hypothetical protein
VIEAGIPKEALNLGCCKILLPADSTDSDPSQCDKRC